MNIQFCYSAAMEEAFCFRVMNDPSSHPNCGEWAVHIHDQLPSYLSESIDIFGQRYGGWLYVLDLLGSLVTVNEDYSGDVAEISEKIMQLSDVTFCYYMLGFCVTEYRLSEENILEWAGDDTLICNALSACDYHAMPVENALYIIHNPGQIKRELCQILQSFWDASFANEWAEICAYVKDVIDHEMLLTMQLSEQEYLEQFHTLLKTDNGVLLFDREPRLSVSMKQIKRIIVTPSIFGDGHLYGNIHDGAVNLTMDLNFKSLHVNRDIPDDYFLGMRALSDESRFKILKLLWKEDATTKEISDILRLAPSTVSIHLKILKDANLVTGRKVKKFVYYRAVKENIEALQKRTIEYLKY